MKGNDADGTWEIASAYCKPRRRAREYREKLGQALRENKTAFFAAAGITVAHSYCSSLFGATQL
jgi:hypothetical protein